MLCHATRLAIACGLRDSGGQAGSGEAGSLQAVRQVANGGGEAGSLQAVRRVAFWPGRQGIACSHASVGDGMRTPGDRFHCYLMFCCIFIRIFILINFEQYFWYDY